MPSHTGRASSRWARADPEAKPFHHGLHLAAFLMNLGTSPIPQTAALPGGPEYIGAFRIGGCAFGVDVGRVREIRDWQPTTELLNAPRGIFGVLNQIAGKRTFLKSAMARIARRLTRASPGARASSNENPFLFFRLDLRASSSIAVKRRAAPDGR